jgi:hypothetical protein
MKYIAIGLHVLAAAVLIWIIAWFLQPPPARMLPVQAGRAAQILTPEVLKRDAETADAALVSLGLLKDRVAGSATPVAYQPKAAPLLGLPIVRDLSAAALRILPTRNLTMVLQSRLEPRAMIDGRLVKPGDELPFNGRVAEINTDRVIVIEKYGKQTLAMAVGQARLGPTSAAKTK